MRASPPKQQEELLPVYDTADDASPVGAQKSSCVHSTGLLHKTVYVFVFNSKRELLLRRRPLDDPVSPDAWCVSASTHLRQDETVADAARRGLAEQLGVALDAGVLVGPIVQSHTRELSFPCETADVTVKGPFLEHEIAETWRLDGLDEALPSTTTESVFVPLSQVRDLANQAPAQFSEWFKLEMREVDWFNNEPS